MKTTIKIQAVSFKTRSVMAAGEWAKVSSEIDLKEFSVGNLYSLDVEKGFNGKWHVLRIDKHVTPKFSSAKSEGLPPEADIFHE